MKSVRTSIAYSHEANFREFLNIIGLQNVKIGSYDNINDNYYFAKSICYLYSEKSEEEVAILTYISLKYGSIHNAYKNFLNTLYSSSMNDPYFNWTP